MLFRKGRRAKQHFPHIRNFTMRGTSIGGLSHKRAVPFKARRRITKRIFMTAFKAYNIFINGHLFHSDPHYQLILFGTNTPSEIGTIHLFLKNQFHLTVANLCMAAMGLRLLITSSGPIVMSGQVRGVTDFMWCRNELPQFDEQYKIFNDWIEQNGGCKDCRW